MLFLLNLNKKNQMKYGEEAKKSRGFNRNKFGLSESDFSGFSDPNRSWSENFLIGFSQKKSDSSYQIWIWKISDSNQILIRILILTF